MRLMSQPLSVLAASSAKALPSQQLAAAEVSLLHNKVHEEAGVPSVVVEDRVKGGNHDVEPSLEPTSSGLSVASKPSGLASSSSGKEGGYMKQRRGGLLSKYSII